MEHESSDSRDGTVAPTTSQSSRAPSSEPSLSRRHPDDSDADASLTRKRPRLDSGSRAMRSLSADTIPYTPAEPQFQHQPTAVATQHPQDSNTDDTPSKLTITVRPHLASPSNDTADEAGPSTAKAPSIQTPLNDTTNPETDSAPMPEEASSGLPRGDARNDSLVASEPKSSSPLIEGEVSNPELTPPQVVFSGEEEMDSDALYESFPYRQPHETFAQAAKNVTEMLQSGNLLCDVLRDFSDWIDEHLAVTAHCQNFWPEFYCSERAFWEQIGLGFFRLIQKGKLQFTDASLVSGFNTIEKLIYSYVNLCNRLMLVDKEMFERLSDDPSEKYRAFCARYLKAVNVLAYGDASMTLREFFGRSYRAKADVVVVRMLRDFLTGPDSGMQLLRFLAPSFFEMSDPNTIYPTVLLESLQTVTGLARCLKEHMIHFGSSEGDLTLQSTFIADAVQIFGAINGPLQDGVGKVSSMSPEHRKCLFEEMSYFLTQIARLSEEQANNLFREHVGDPNSAASVFRPELIGHVWRIKTLRKQVAKSKMEIRVMGVDLTQQLLLTAWNDRHQSGDDPVLQYLAMVLLDEKIINYLVGVDSHPTLIQRCGNIVGLVAVTRRYGPAETDLIWNTIANSSDPRVISATLTMLTTIVDLLMVPDLMYFCKKLEALPITSYTPDVVAFWQRVLTRARSIKDGEPPGSILLSWLSDRNRMNAYDLCMRIMKETFPGRCPMLTLQTLHPEAISELMQLVQKGNFADRQRIYAALSRAVQEPSRETAPNMEILYHMLRHSPEPDMDAATSLGLFRITIEELCSYVSDVSQTECVAQASGPWLHDLNARLDLIVLFLQRRLQSATEELLLQLWNVMVGRDAINSTARDAAWWKLAQAALPHAVDQPFLELFLTKYLPKLEPQHYTPHLYLFIDKGVKYQLTVQDGSQLGEDGLVQIPSADFLWRAMLSAPVGTIEDHTSVCLASLYSEKALGNVEKTAVEATHISVAGRCIREMIAAASQFHSQAMDMEEKQSTDRDESVVPASVRFQRIVFFLGTLLQNVRKSAFLGAEPKHSVDADMESETKPGRTIVVKYQAFNGHEGAVQSVEVGDLETRRALHGLLRKLTGFPSFYTICGGQKFDLLEEPAQTLREWGKATVYAILVKKTDAASHLSDMNIDVGRCAMELEILKSFDKLYELMDYDDEMAHLTYDFLAKFPPHESGQLTALCSGTASVDDAFPVGKGLKTRYSIRCLQARLEFQLRTNAIESPFVHGSLSLLSAALSRDSLAENSIADQSESSSVHEMIHCFLSFLREAPGKTESLGDGESLVTQLLTILKHAIDRSQENLVCMTYASILNALQHSASVCRTLRSRKDFEGLHKMFMFADVSPRPVPLPGQHSRPTVQAHVANLIKEKIKVETPWACMSSSSLAAFIWKMFSSLVKDAVKFPKHSAEFFMVANTCFIKLYNKVEPSEVERSKEELKALFRSWSTMFLVHQHEEFAGRNECDHVIFGLAQLLKQCAIFLDQLESPLEADLFVTDVFDRFLFPPLSDDNPHAMSAQPTPILDSSTRETVNKLILTLSKDPKGLRKLINRTNNALIMGNIPQTIFYRERMLRSPTGLIGVKNLGNTCYMNSLLTQLFMNVDFRKFILSTPAQSETQPLLFHMQKLFTRMQNGFSKWVDALALTQSIRTFDGESIDVTVQMDVEEFENLLFDQLEGQIDGPLDKQVFRNFYGGQMINQVKSKECEHVSERLEPYFAVQCDVKGKTNILDSLQAFVEGDVMEGDNKYKCESCGGRFVSAVKRTCLKDVPDNLIFHLKRFDFDVGTMQRSKINDLFEFPMRINVAPYTYEHLNDPEAPVRDDPFDLVGVLLHKGVAEHGHYFSYIRSRPSANGENEQWVQFDDAEVTEFDPREIKEKCFGGWMDTKDVPMFDGQIMQKGYNAYMLFYQRTNTIERTDSLVNGPSSVEPPKVAVPQALEKDVAQDNEVTLRQYTLFDPTHMSFVESLIAQLPTSRGERICSGLHQFENNAIRLVVRYLHQVHSRKKDSNAIKGLFEILRRLLGDCLDCNTYALELMVPSISRQGENIFLDLAIRSSQAEVRQEFTNLLLEILFLLRENADISAYGTTNSDDEYDPDMPFTCQDGAIMRITRVCTDNIVQLATNMRAWDDYFHFCLRIAALGVAEVSAFLELGALQTCLEIVACYTTDTDNSPGWKRFWKILSKRRAHKNKLIEFVYMLLSAFDLALPPVEDDDERIAVQSPSGFKFPLLMCEEETMTSWDTKNQDLLLVERMFDAWEYAPTETCYPSEILGMLMTARVRNFDSHHVFNTLLLGIDGYGTSNVAPFYDGAAAFCRWSKSKNYLDQLMTACVRQTFKPDTNRACLLRFFQTVSRLPNQHFPEQYLLRAVIREAKLWLPNLLMDSDQTVRTGASNLANELFFVTPVTADTENPTEIEEERVRQLRNVMIDGGQRLHRVFETQEVAKQWLTAIIEFLEKAAGVLMNVNNGQTPALAKLGNPNDDALIERYQAFRVRYESWPYEESEAGGSDEEWSEAMMTDTEEYFDG